MTNRLKLLAAVAAIALPAGFAGAQSVAPGGGAMRPATGTETVTTTVQTPATTNRATEDAQISTEATTSPTTTTASIAQPPTQAPMTQAGASAQMNAQAGAAAAPIRLATAADLRAGIQVRDQTGGLVGTVESADATGAVVSTGTVRARLALASFGANGQALVISMTRAQLEAAAAQAAPRPGAG